MKHTDETSKHDLPFVVRHGQETNENDKKAADAIEYRVSDLCPACTQGHFDYNGVLNLECDECKYTLAGCST
jgi:ribosomal protein L37AE/L43A